MAMTEPWDRAVLNLLTHEAQHMPHLRITAANDDIDAAIRAICDAIEARNRAPIPATDVARWQREAEIIFLMGELAYLNLLAQATTDPD